jgi:hypothetical protein
LTEIFANDILKEIQNKKDRESRIKIIEKLQEDLNYAIYTFKNDKKNYEDNQKQDFLRKKIYLDQKIKNLWDIHIKMLKKECIILS